MITLFGRVLGKKNRLYLAYEQDWLKWAQVPAGTVPAGTFPTFEEWLAARAVQTAVLTTTRKEDGHVRS